MMDSQLFLVKHLLPWAQKAGSDRKDHESRPFHRLLREQVAAFECELVRGPGTAWATAFHPVQSRVLQVVSEKYFNFANVWEAAETFLSVAEQQVQPSAGFEPEAPGRDPRHSEAYGLPRGGASRLIQEPLEYLGRLGRRNGTLRKHHGNVEQCDGI